MVRRTITTIERLRGIGQTTMTTKTTMTTTTTTTIPLLPLLVLLNTDQLDILIINCCKSFNQQHYPAIATEQIETKCKKFRREHTINQSMRHSIPTKLTYSLGLSPG